MPEGDSCVRVAPVWVGVDVYVPSKGEVVSEDFTGDEVAAMSRSDESGAGLAAEVGPVLRALAESRARFADSEARRVELEGVIATVREKLVMYRDQYLQGVWLAMAVGHTIDAAPSTVLGEQDQEVAARAWDEGVVAGAQWEYTDAKSFTDGGTAVPRPANPYRVHR